MTDLSKLEAQVALLATQMAEMSQALITVARIEEGRENDRAMINSMILEVKNIKENMGELKQTVALQGQKSGIFTKYVNRVVFVAIGLAIGKAFDLFK